MKSFLFTIVLAILSVAVLPAISPGTAHAYSFEVTGRTSLTTSATLIIDSSASNTTEAVKFSSCDYVEVCADHRNTSVMFLDKSTTSLDALGIGRPVYPLPASGPTCQPWGEKKEPFDRSKVSGDATRQVAQRAAKTIDARTIAAKALAGSSNRLSLFCEVYN